jgi:hypothetical protein
VQADTTIDLTPHLTNTSLQTHRGEEGVRLLSELVGCSILSGDTPGALKLTNEHIEMIVTQMAEVLSETFKAAVQSSVHFQVGSLHPPVTPESDRAPGSLSLMLSSSTESTFLFLIFLQLAKNHSSAFSY